MEKHSKMWEKDRQGPSSDNGSTGDKCSNWPVVRTVSIYHPLALDKAVINTVLESSHLGTEASCVVAALIPFILKMRKGGRVPVTAFQGHRLRCGTRHLNSGNLTPAS